MEKQKTKKENIKVKKTLDMKAYQKEYYAKNKYRACYMLSNLRKKAKRG